jgi:predicted alpha-1,6-mannanase (GH76 family)
MGLALLSPALHQRKLMTLWSPGLAMPKGTGPAHHPSRKFHILGLGIQVLCLWFALSAPCQTAATFHARADLALQNFLLEYWSGSQQYLKANYPDDGQVTGYWTYAHGWEALMDGVERTGGQQYAGLIESFYLGQNARGWYSGYYDDECWMILALTHAYDLTADLKYLNQATALYTDVMSAWDTTCCGTVHGGVWWDRAHTQKATASNAGAALAGARLFQRSGNAEYLSFAKQVYGYWFSNMMDPGTFQVADHFQADGSKVWWRFTYNEGLMVGASVELSAITGDFAYLTNANNIEHFMIQNETTSTGYGPALYDGPNTGCGGDCHEFKGPAYRYLMRLYTQNTNRTDYFSVLRGSANALWSLAHNATSGVFSVNWAGPVQAVADQPQDNAAVIALNRFAQQSGPYPGSGIPPGQYEAENATLNSLGLEAKYTGFSGWGYIAGWNGDGQSVEFGVNCDLAGKYLLTFRYAAGAGNATRSLVINGTNVYAAKTFASTGAWTSYSTLTVPATLLSGVNTVALSYNSSQGSANYSNLDNLVVVSTVLKPMQVNVSLSSSGMVHLAWLTVVGHAYQVQYATAASGPWTNLGNVTLALGTRQSLDDPIGPDLARLYRIVAN